MENPGSEAPLTRALLGAQRYVHQRAYDSYQATAALDTKPPNTAPASAAASDTTTAESKIRTLTNQIKKF